MSDIDFLGAEGGRMAAAFGGGCVAAWAFLRTIVTGSLRSRIRDLEASREDLERLRERDAEHCDRELARQSDRILQLETLLMAHAPGNLAQAVQRAISERSLIDQGVLTAVGGVKREGGT